MPIAVALIGGAIMAGTSMAQSNSARSAQREANVSNVNLNRENRDWQERMAGSAHQREVADLRAAGLNPILSGTGGAGSATPGNSAASVSAEPPRTFGDVGGAAASAVAARQQQKLMEATIEKTQSEANMAKDMELETANKVSADNAYRSWLLNKKQPGDEPLNRQEQLWEAAYDASVAETQGKQFTALQGPINLDTAKQHLRQLVQQTNIGASAEAKAKVDEEINKSTLGEVLTWIDRLSKSVQGVRR